MFSRSDGFVMAFSAAGPGPQLALLIADFATYWAENRPYFVAVHFSLPLLQAHRFSWWPVTLPFSVWLGYACKWSCLCWSRPNGKWSGSHLGRELWCRLPERPNWRWQSLSPAWSQSLYHWLPRHQPHSHRFQYSQQSIWSTRWTKFKEAEWRVVHSASVKSLYSFAARYRYLPRSSDGRIHKCTDCTACSALSFPKRCCRILCNSTSSLSHGSSRICLNYPLWMPAETLD